MSFTGQIDFCLFCASVDPKHLDRARHIVNKKYLLLKVKVFILSELEVNAVFIIYSCVCVCVCACARAQVGAGVARERDQVGHRS